MTELALAPRKRRPRDIGTADETAVVRYIRTNGFPHAERRALRGNLDAGDITGTPGVAWEVKGGKAGRTASDGLVLKWLLETRREQHNARADVGILVLPRPGIGVTNVGSWWAVMRMKVDSLGGFVIGATDWPGPYATVRTHLADTLTMLRAAGYGNPLPQEAS